MSLLPPSPAAAMPWPDLPGVPQPQTRERLLGNLGLFLMLLRRLTTQFADLCQPPALPDDPTQRLALEQRLHRLAGSAGQLGAQTVSQHARAAEQALRAPTLAEVPAHLTALAQALSALTEAARPVLAQAQAELDPLPQAAPGAPALLDQAELALLRQQLREQKFSALVRCQQLRPTLGQLLSPLELQTLDNALQQLHFQTALALLQPL